MRPRVFWQDNRGTGASVNSIIDHALNNRWMLRNWTVLTAEDAVEGLGWQHSFIAYQTLNSKTAYSYNLFASGESDSLVDVEDYGVELRLRRRFAREYFFVELSTRVNWPRFEVEERRSANFGVGIEFEMQFGDWPGRTAPTGLVD